MIPAFATSSIRATLQRTLRRALAISASLVAIGVAASAVVHYRITQERAKLLLVKEVESLSVAGVIGQDLLSVDREVNRFVESWEQTQPLSAEVGVRLNGKLIARAGELSGWGWLSTAIKQESVLANRMTLTVSVITNSASYWKRIATILVAAEALVGIFFLALLASLNRSAGGIVLPLSQTIEWLGVVAAELPRSLDQGNPNPRSEFTEVRSLNESIETLLSRISTLQTNLTKTQIDRARVEVAEQVGHDLKSLVATIELRLGRMNEFERERRDSIRDALTRIRGVVDSLKRQSAVTNQPLYLTPLGEGPKDESESAVLLAPLVDCIVSEKRELVAAAGRPIRIQFETYANGCLAASIDAIEFQRSVSNLLDNSIDAIQEVGNILVHLGQRDGFVEVSVVDSGCGIPAELLARIAQRGESFGKEGGSGLGLYYARSCVENWGGSLEIQSTPGTGTTVALRFPKVDPVWLPNSLDCSVGRTLVILDDDLLVHGLWKMRFSGLENAPVAEFYSSHLEFEDAQRGRTNLDTVTYLIDHDLGEGNPSGLDLVEKHGIAPSAILVSGIYDRPDVVNRARNLGVLRMSKDWIGIVPMGASADGQRASGATIRRGSGDVAEFVNRPARPESVGVLV